MKGKQRPFKQWISLLLAIIMLAGIVPMEAMALTPSGAINNQTTTIDLGGIWDFTPDTEAKSVTISADREEDAVALTPIGSSEIQTKLTLDDPTKVYYGKVMALIEVAATANAPILYAKVNDGEWYPLSLEGTEVGRKFWAELPLNPSDLKAGENIVSLKSSVNDNSIMLYGTADDGRHCVRIKYYPSIPSDWQDMTVPGAWEGNFTLGGNEETEEEPEEEETVSLGMVPAMSVAINNTVTQLVDLTSYKGQDAAQVEIPLDLSALQNGTNTFRFSSNVVPSSGQNNSASVDISFYILAAGADVTGNGFYQSGAFNQNTSDVPAVDLMLKKSDGTWETVRAYTDGRVGSVICGLLKDNGHTYEIQSALPVSDLSVYTEAKLMVNTHVGADVQAAFKAENLLPMDPAMCMVTNGTDSQLIDLAPYQGQDTGIEIPVDLSTLQSGSNTFRFSTNVTAGPGQFNANSVDIFYYATADGVDPTDNGYYESGRFNQATTDLPQVDLMLKQRNGEWISLCNYKDTYIGHVVCGPLSDNGHTYEIQSAITVDNPALYTEAKVVVYTHVGSDIKATSHGKDLLPENQIYPALGVTINQNDGTWVDLTPYKGVNGAVEVPLELSTLQTGTNTFRFSTNVRTADGQNNSTSVDMLQYIYADGVDLTDEGCYASDVFGPYSTHGVRADLMLKKSDGTWVTVTKHTDTVKDSCILGVFPGNGVTYEGQVSRAVDNLSAYTEAKLMVYLHVGSDVTGAFDQKELLPEKKLYPALGVTINRESTTLVDLTNYKGTTGAVEVPLDLSSLEKGANTFRFSTNVRTADGQNNATSVDMLQYIYADGVDMTDEGCYIDDSLSPYSTHGVRADLMLKKSDGTWVTVTKHTDTIKDSCILGVFPGNGMTFEGQVSRTIDAPEAYTEAKLMVYLHVGEEITYAFDPQELLKSTEAAIDPLLLKVSVNDTLESHDITSMLGSTAVADVTLDYANIKTGDNVFVIDSNTASNSQGQNNPGSLDIIISTPTTPTGDDTGYWADGAYNALAADEAFYVTLLLQRKDNDQWVEVKTHAGDNVKNIIVGVLNDNGVRYRPQVTLSVDDASAYKAARLQVMLHVGASVPRVTAFESDGDYDNAQSDPIESGDPVLRLGVNSTDDWESYNLKAYAGTTADLMIPVSVGSLVAGSNEFYFHSNTLNGGNMTSDSVDLLTELDTNGYKDSAYSQDGLSSYNELGSEGTRFMVGLALKRKDTGEWIEVRTYSGSHATNLVVGKFTPNGKTYIPRIILPVDDPSLYSEAVVLAKVHVGNEIAITGSDSYLYDGVGWYRRTLTLPEKASGEEQWLHFEAIDYKAEIFLNGCFLGSHEGGYAPFDLPLSTLGDAVRYGGENELVIRVTDQSTDVGSDVIPIKETPAGFLQDTIGINYAGIWGDVSLVTKGSVYSDHLYVDTDIDTGVATLEATVYNPTSTQLTLAVTGSVTQTTGEANGSGETTVTIPAGSSAEVSIPVTLTECTLWQIDNPHLYTATLTVSGSGVSTDTLSTDFGMREVERDGNKVVFNDNNIFLTGWITWEVYWDTVAPTPTVEEVEQLVLDLKEAGFNAIKYCLVVPPDYVLDVFDRMGLYIYIEYPIWEPVETEDFFTRCYLQFPELVEKDRNHPSVIMSDFACELPTFSSEMDTFMNFIVNKAKEIDPNRLFTSNSSTGTNKYGDFRTWHPYMGVNEFDSVIDGIASSRGNYPLVLGEYADSRTMSNRDEILEACDGTPWWWEKTSSPPNAYGAFEAQGFSSEEIDQFKDYSYLSSLEAKRAYIEDSKKNSSVAALFLTQLVDIKHNSCGFYDELGNLKFDPEELEGSAGESAIVIDDMAHNFAAGTTATITPAISHYNGKDIVNGKLTYTITQGDTVVLSGTAQEGIHLANGDYYCFDDLNFVLPDTKGAEQYTLTLTLECDSFTTQNHWDIWGYSTHALRDNGKDVAYYDPSDLYNFDSVYPWMTEWTGGSTPDVVITTKITNAINTYLEAGGKVIYLGAGSGPVTSSEEQNHFTNFTSSSTIFFPDETHPLVEALSSNDYGGIQFLDLATYKFMPYQNTDGLQGTTIFGRLSMPDARLDSYLSEFTVNKGYLLQCTLRLDTKAVNRGSLTVKAGPNPLGSYLIDQMLRYVAGDENEAGVTDLTIDTPPTKVEYRLGDDIDLTGMTATFTDTLGGSYPATITNAMLSGYDKNTAGEQTVTVTYEGKTATFTVTFVSQEMYNRRQAIADTEAAIEAIGEITKANLLEPATATVLEAAKAAMGSLKETYGDAVESEVSNAADLTAARTAYDTLYAEYTTATEDFKVKVGDIGEVTKDTVADCLEPITKAEEALDALLDNYGDKAIDSITQYIEALSLAREEYDRLIGESDIDYGDIDGNGRIDASDALKALQHSVKLITLTGDDFIKANVDGNTKVDASDALYILQHSVKLITQFPVHKQ